jgi:hypothetical protein
LSCHPSFSHLFSAHLKSSLFSSSQLLHSTPQCETSLKKWKWKMWKRSCRSTQSWICQNERLVRNFPQKEKVEDVKTKLSIQLNWILKPNSFHSVQFIQFNSTQLKSVQFNSIQLSSVQVNSIQLSLTQVNSIQFTSFNSTQLSSTQVNSFKSSQPVQCNSFNSIQLSSIQSNSFTSIQCSLFQFNST